MAPDLRSPVVRDEKGRVVGGGGSLNPGGVSKRLRKVRKALQKMDAKALKTLEALMSDADAKVALKAVEIWAKYSVPIPKETPAERENRAAGLPPVSDSIRAKLARLAS